MMADLSELKPNSGFPAVNRIVEAIEAQSGRDYAPNDSKAKFIVTSIAEENGFFDQLCLGTYN